MNVSWLFGCVILAVVSLEVLKWMLQALTITVILSAFRITLPMIIVGAMALMATGKIEAAFAMATSVQTVMLGVQRAFSMSGF